MSLIKHYENFSEVIDYLGSKKDYSDSTLPRRLNLLLGNGFSVNYSHSIFTYKALADYVSKNGVDLVNKLFTALKTENFELIMEQLDQMISVLKAIPDLHAAALSLAEAKEGLKKALLDAIRASHPEHVFDVKESEINKCAEFLRIFINTDGKIFTTNYDLLLYWVINRGLDDKEKLKDGFGRFITNPEEVKRGGEAVVSDLVWTSKNEQNVFNLHGGLQIFDNSGSIIKETYRRDTGEWLLDKINSRLDGGNYPIFVTDGNGEKKLKHIKSNRYLSNAYENLREINGSLIVFGFSFSANDYHIIDAINAAAKVTAKGKNIPGSLLSVFIGVYSDADREYIESISHKFALKISTFDSKTTGIWR